MERAKQHPNDLASDRGADRVAPARAGALEKAVRDDQGGTGVPSDHRYRALGTKFVDPMHDPRKK
jgi:hypothetical protein